MAARASSTTAPVRRRLDFSNNSFDEDEEDFPSPKKRGNLAMPAISTTKLPQVERLRPGLTNAIIDEQNDSLQEESAMLAEDDDFQLLDAGNNEEMLVMDEEEEEPEEEPEIVEESLPTKKGKGKMKAVEMKQAPGKRGRLMKQAESVEEEEDEAESPAIEEEVVQPVKKSGRSKKNAVLATADRSTTASPEVVKKKGGRPPKRIAEEVEEVEEEPLPATISPELVKKKARPAKRAAVEEESKEVEEEQPRPAKRTRRSLDTVQTNKSKPQPKENTTTKEPAKPKARKPKLAAISEADSSLVVHGPPIPRNNKGLFIFRRETPMEGIGFKQTRSGRNSIRPVDYWKGEKIEYDTEFTKDAFGKNRLMPTIKEVTRTDEIDQRRRQARSKSKGPRAKKHEDLESEDEAELEPWEVAPGVIHGEIRAWDPIDQLGAQAEVTETEIAFSAGAIVTSQIPNATFRFAKTLTLPFFGSGMVDVPPGGAKKLKNSRKMQMVFFVYRGRVQVTVNDTSFRIGTGGMWQVPRGNFYSIENDYDKEARIFFSQGCEVAMQEAEDSQ